MAQIHSNARLKRSVMAADGSNCGWLMANVYGDDVDNLILVLLVVARRFCGHIAHDAIDVGMGTEIEGLVPGTYGEVVQLPAAGIESNQSPMEEETTQTPILVVHT